MKKTDENTGKRVKLEREIEDPKVVRDYIMYQKHPNNREFIELWERHNVSIKRQEKRKREKARMVADNAKRKRYLELKLEKLDREDRNNKRKLSHKEQSGKGPRCTACHQRGHMKTNRLCPKYRHERTVKESGVLTKVGGLLIINKQLLRKEQQESKRAKRGIVKHNGVDLGPHRKHQLRKRLRGEGSHIIDLCKHLTICIDKMKKHEQVGYFLHDPRTIPDYSQKIEYPMCMDWIIDYIRLTEKTTQGQADSAVKSKSNPYNRIYKSTEDFMEDVCWMRSNCAKFNGETNCVTNWISEIVNIAQDYIRETPELQEIERALRQVSRRKELREQFENMIKAFKSHDPHNIFALPVDTKRYKNYNKKVQRAMSFKVIENNLQLQKYDGFNSFAEDIKQIYLNSKAYNGPKHPITATSLRGLNAVIAMAAEQLPLIKEKDPEADLSFIQLNDDE